MMHGSINLTANHCQCPSLTSRWGFCLTTDFEIARPAASPKLAPMTLTMTIPDDLSSDLNAGFQNLGRTALEALAAEAYEKGVLSLEQVRRMLGFASRWEAQDFLCNHGVWPGHTAEEILQDADTSARFRTTLS